MNKKHAPLRAKNDVTHELQLKLHKRMKKEQIANKNCDDEIKNTKRRPIIAPALAVRLLVKIKIKVKRAHVKRKPLARTGNSVQTKTRPRMTYAWIGKNI